ncbi:MAG: replication-relaxation family protein [Acidimicrobiia bacterium]
MADEQRLALARRLTDRDRRIVRAVARFRVLTSDQLTEVFFSSQKSALARLLSLHRLGVLDRFQPHRPSWGSYPYHYVLGPLGAAVLAAEAGDDPDRPARRWRPERTLALGHTQRLAHLVGVNAFYASLVGHARRYQSARLASWLTEAECARWSEGIVRPDAFGEWHEDGAAVEFFLEYDRGTETLARLVDKLGGYERFEAERGASSWVAFAFGSPRREATARRALAAATVPAATAALGGPLRPPDALWLPVAGHGRRLRLAALGAAPKPTEALRRAATGGPRAWRFERSRPDDEEAPIETP